MDRLPQGAALAAAFLSVVALTACGGQTSAAAPAAAEAAPAVQTVTGVSTPASVSVVTAKNAE